MNVVMWFLIVVAAFFVLLISKVALDLANKEVQGWLFDLPVAILRLARLRLPRHLRGPLYDDERLEDELRTILFYTYDKKPITALIKGTGFALGHVVGLRRSARVLGAPSLIARIRAVLRRQPPASAPAATNQDLEQRLAALIQTRIVSTGLVDWDHSAADAKWVGSLTLSVPLRPAKNVDIADLVCQASNITRVVQVKHWPVQRWHDPQPRDDPM